MRWKGATNSTTGKEEKDKKRVPATNLVKLSLLGVDGRKGEVDRRWEKRGNAGERYVDRAVWERGKGGSISFGYRRIRKGKTWGKRKQPASIEHPLAKKKVSDGLDPSGAS